VICKSPSCGQVFVCEERECVAQHLHSRGLLNVHFIEKLVEEAKDLQAFVFREVEAEVEEYFERACEEFNQAINQYKELAYIKLEGLRAQIAPAGGLSPEALARLRDVYSCSKEELVRGW
jgi:hypothetical protein